MKNIVKLLCLAIIASITVTSCSVEKRHYMPGYRVEWKNKGKTSAVKEGVAVTENTGVQKEDKVKEVAAVEATNAVVMNETQEQLTTTVVQQELIVPATNQKDKTPVFSEENVSETANEQEIAQNNQTTKTNNTNQKPASPKGDAPLVLLIILCILFPLSIVAVAIATDLGIETLWNFLWCITIIGGIIHGIIVVMR